MRINTIRKTKIIKSILFISCAVLAVDVLIFAGTCTLAAEADAAAIARIDGADEAPALAGTPKDAPAGDGVTDDKKGENSPDDASSQIIFQAAKERGLLILANKQNPLPSDYKPDDLVVVDYFAENREKVCSYLQAEARDYFHQLVEAAKEAGHTLMMTSGYRSYNYQQVLWDNYVETDGEAAAARYSAKPGQSEHQTGLAADVTSPGVNLELVDNFGETAEGRWMIKNAHNYGFILRYPKGKEAITGYMYEPWHIRYVGKDVATEIYKRGVTLEEYLSEK